MLLELRAENYSPVVNKINQSGDKAFGISTDVTNAKSVRAAFEQIQVKLPGLGLTATLFNLKGQFLRKPFLELTEEEFRAPYETQGYV